MSEDVLVIVLVAGMVLAFALGVWIGLGYPGLYDKYEQTGKASRRSPFFALVDWLTGGAGRPRAPRPRTESRGRKRFLRDREPPGRRR